MKKEFLSYEMALELKKLGFDEPCIGNYRKVQVTDAKTGDSSESIIYLDVMHFTINFNENNKETDASALTFHQAFRWFREKYNFHSNIKCVNTVYNNHFRFEIDSNGETLACTNKIESYEKAELRCLQKMIETIKNK
jgi:hypothetical protein